MPLGGVGTGVLVESHMGRPTKIEGNPDHPSSLGATDAFMQASILGLYDPDRSQVVRHLGEISTWSEFIGALQHRSSRQWRAAPSLHADRHLADARRADPAAPRAVSGTEVASVGAGESRQRPRRIAHGVRQLRERRLSLRQSECDRLARLRFRRQRPRASALRARLRVATPRAQRRHVDESSLRDRIVPERNRRSRRPSIPRPPVRGGIVGARTARCRRTALVRPCQRLLPIAKTSRPTAARASSSPATISRRSSTRSPWRSIRASATSDRRSPSPIRSKSRRRTSSSRCASSSPT